MDARPSTKLFVAMLVMVIAAVAVQTSSAAEAAVSAEHNPPLDAAAAAAAVNAAAASPIGDAGALLSGLGGAPEHAPEPTKSSATTATFSGAAFACSAAMALVFSF